MASRGTRGMILPPHGDESLAEYVARQSNPIKPSVENNAEIDAANKVIHDRLHGRSESSPDARTSAPPSRRSSAHSPRHSPLMNGDD